MNEETVAAIGRLPLGHGLLGDFLGSRAQGKHRSATERTVVSLTPIRRATNTRSAGDPSLPSKASNTRARMIIIAGWAPADTTLVNRSH